MKKLTPKVLIADDDMDMLIQLEMKLKQLGFDVIKASSQLEAEKVLSETRPDLAIYDLMMESLDSGFILSYKTKKLFPEVPVIIATAVTSETGMTFNLDTRTDRDWIKADLFLEKSIRTDQLRREISRLMKTN